MNSEQLQTVLNAFLYLLSILGWLFVPVSIIWVYAKTIGKSHTDMAKIAIGTIVSLIYIVLSVMAWQLGKLVLLVPALAGLGLLWMDIWYIGDTIKNFREKKWMHFIFNGLGSLIITTVIVGSIVLANM